MKSGQSPNLPVETAEYSFENEQAMRKAMEHYLEDLRDDIVDLQNQTNPVASLALRRHQFLLMGG